MSYIILRGRWCDIIVQNVHAPTEDKIDDIRDRFYEELECAFFHPHYGPGVDSVPNRNEYQKSSWGKGRPARKADNFTAVCEPIV
jgi:formylmethanofuran dehydrogenase subunit E-like metal-binding protein